MVHIFWPWLLLIVPALLLAGFQIGSIVEYRKKYNFADLELDLLDSLEAKATAEEKALIQKLRAMKKVF